MVKTKTHVPGPEESPSEWVELVDLLCGRIGDNERPRLASLETLSELPVMAEKPVDSSL